MKLIILGFGFLSTLMMALGKVMIPSGKVTWKADPELKSALSSKPCDIPIIDGSNPIEIALSSYPRTPVIFRNFTSHWPANILWDKEDLSKAFGERIIRAGTESSIVYSAGNAEMNIRLDQFLRGLDNSSMFAFDTTILTAIPELNQHFQVPPIFADWDTPEKEENKELWHMISIGPSRSGLPFHNHGKTWLAVIKGSKYWFLYPPGYGPPREADLVFNALNSSFDWYSKVHSLALAFAEDIAPLEPNIESGRSSSKGYRPLECLQQAGDVMFLPSMWSHMTLNVGQTIAIGGQQYLTEQERFDTALKAFRNNASSYETFKDLALGGFYSIWRIQEQYRSLLRRNCPDRSWRHILCTNNTGDLQRFAMDSLDSLVVVYYSHSTARNVSTLLGDLDSLWRALADEDLELDVVAMEYTAEAIPDLQLDGELFSVPHVLSDSISMPLLVIYEGWLQADVDHAVSLLQQRQYRELGRWYQGPEVARYISLSCEVDCVSIMKQEVLSWAGSTSIASGALLAGSTVSMQLRAIQGIKLLRSAMSIRPLHPEVLYFLSEFAVHAGDAGWEEASEALMRAEDSYDRFRIILSIPRLTFASLYHKLAAAYEKNGRVEVALRLTEKSLSIDDTFLPALRDKMRLLLQLKRREDAERTLVLLRRVVELHGLGKDMADELQEYHRELLIS